MNPHISTPPRPSTLQWKVGKKSSPWSSFLWSCFAVLVFAFCCFLAIIGSQRKATLRAVHACDTGHTTCRISMGYSALRVKSEDAAEDQTVCGDGWRACVDAASEGNIQ
jgi:hypothetical protein